MFIYCDGTNISQPGQYGTTPAQFDNSQKLITSAFLRSAGLQSSGLNIVSATGNIPVSYVGGDVLFSSASAITGTLPAASSVPSGGRITFTNFNNGVATVARAGTDNIFLNTGPSTTVALGVGDSLTLESSGSTAWYAVGGSAQLGSSAAFGSSFGTTNYQKLPSGMIMQWGQSTCTNTADTTITLPIAFPSVFNSVVATFAHNAGATASALIEAAPSGLTGFIARNNAGSSGFYWIAFGK